jgi:uncharacterized membrane protein
MALSGEEVTASGAPDRGSAAPSDRSRWIAAVAYIGFISLFSLREARRDEFVRAHASQAVLLFLFECAAVVVAAVLGATVGRIRVLGLIVILCFELMSALAAISLSIVGFIKALFGEDWRMPFLGEYRDRVPGIWWGRS